jgi:hypothetical protein
MLRAAVTLLSVAALSLLTVSAPSAGAASGSCPAASVLVRLDRTDGFSFDEHVVVCANGRSPVSFSYRPGRGTRCRTVVVVGPTLRHLKQILASARFALLRASYLPDSEPSEVTQYRVTHRGQLVATDAVALSRGLVPARLARVVRALNTLLNSWLETPENYTRKVPPPRPLPASHPC